MGEVYCMYLHPAGTRPHLPRLERGLGREGRLAPVLVAGE